MNVLDMKIIILFNNIIDISIMEDNYNYHPCRMIIPYSKSLLPRCH